MILGRQNNNYNWIAWRAWQSKIIRCRPRTLHYLALSTFQQSRISLFASDGVSLSRNLWRTQTQRPALLRTTESGPHIARSVTGLQQTRWDEGSCNLCVAKSFKLCVMVETQPTDNFNGQSATSLGLISYGLRPASTFSPTFFHLFCVLIHPSSGADGAWAWVLVGWIHSVPPPSVRWVRLMVVQQTVNSAK